MKTNYEKAFELVREHIESQVKVDPDFYGQVSEKVRSSIVDDQAHRYVQENGEERILSHQLKLDLTQMLEEASISHFIRITPKGARFTIVSEENISIDLNADRISVYSNSLPIIEGVLSLSELMEAVDLDMRTKKFRETIKRRCGEKYCKETERVDMRTRSFKSAMKRAEERKKKGEARAQQLKELEGKKKPQDYNEVFKKHVMRESLQEAGVNGGEKTNARVVAEVLSNILSLIKEPKDFDALLVSLKAAGINPLPIKHELDADAERIFALRHTNKDISYIIANIKKISDIALAVLDKEEPESEKDKEEIEESRDPLGDF